MSSHLNSLYGHSQLELKLSWALTIMLYLIVPAMILILLSQPIFFYIYFITFRKNVGRRRINNVQYSVRLCVYKLTYDPNVLEMQPNEVVIIERRKPDDLINRKSELNSLDLQTVSPTE